MKRIIPRHFTRTGKPKVAYKKEEAQALALQNYKRWRAYKCDFCNRWHIGGYR